MDRRPVLYVTGLMLLILSVSMVFPMAVEFARGGEEWKVFLASLLITMFFGGSLAISNAGGQMDINIRQAFLLTVLSWMAIGFFGALPFYLSVLNLSFTDSLFESISGITTTGATILEDIEAAPPGILLWRAMLQWLGGVGFVVMAMSILPLLKVGGMRLFRTESSENEKALPRAAQLSRSIGFIYVLLSFACMVCYIAAGQSPFHALLHAMTTMASGGFSPFNSSFAGFNTVWSEVTAIVFMILSGLPFILYIKMMGGNFRAFIVDKQVQVFMVILIAATLAIALHLTYAGYYTLDTALLKAAFNVVSVTTGTGYTNADYGSWGYFPFSTFFMLMFIGACAGSTSGGIKIFRVQVLFAVTRVQSKRLLYPHGIFAPHYNGRPIPDDVPPSVMGFFFVYMIACAFSVILLSMMGLDFITAFSGAVSAISNVGPGLGDVIGPAGTYAPLPDGAKWLLSLLMLLGRLEIYTILVLLSPHFWRI